jgi:nucleotide-binding universal stress UspA family protein
MPWASEIHATVLSVDDGRTDVASAVASATQTLQAAGVTVEQQIFHDGEPTLDVLRYLEQHDTDLVVLGTQGLTGIRRLRLGSTASVLAHSTPHSVLLVCAESAIDDERH